MISYPLKPYFYSRTIQRLGAKREKYKKMQRKKQNLEKFRYMYSHTPYFKREERKIKRTMSEIYNRFIKRDAIINIYKRNSCILYSAVVNRKVWIHRGGKDLIPITFRRFSVANKKIGEFIRTKYLGKIIHLDNKIAKKLAKKKKQIAAEVLQRKARKSKVKSKSKKKK